MEEQLFKGPQSAFPLLWNTIFRTIIFWLAPILLMLLFSSYQYKHFCSEWASLTSSIPLMGSAKPEMLPFCLFWVFEIEPSSSKYNFYYIWNFLPRIFTGSTRLDGNAIGKYLTHLWNCRASCYNCLTITNEASRVLLGLACSWLCPLAVCRVHGRAGFPPPPPHVQLAEDRGDLLLQHESDPTAVVPNMACDWRSLQ